MIRVLTTTEYEAVINEENADFCACCGGKFDIAGLVEAQMPDLERPETISGFITYPLIGGLSICYPCSSHCDDGPCEPDNLVKIRPQHILLAEDGCNQPRVLGVNTMNRDHDDEQWVSTGWKAWTHDGVIYCQGKDEAVVLRWLADNGYVDTGDGAHYERSVGN